MSRLKLAVVLLAVVSMAACGGGDSSSDSDSSDTTATEASEDTASGVPNACRVISADELASLTGSPPGEATDRTAYESRSVCQYAAGPILSVEVAGNFAATRSLAEEQGIKTTDVPGVGSEAYTDASGQVVAKGNQYFVGVAIPGADLETAKKVATAMLQKADA